MTDTSPTPQRLRELARGKAYPPSVLREALQRAASNIEILSTLAYDTDGLARTIIALVAASDGRVEVPVSIIEDVNAYEIEKSEGIGSIIYATRKVGGEKDAPESN